VELLEDVLFAQHSEHILQAFPELLTSVYRTQKATLNNDTNPDDEPLFGGRINKEALAILSTLFELSEKTDQAENLLTSWKDFISASCAQSLNRFFLADSTQNSRSKEMLGQQAVQRVVDLKVRVDLALHRSF